MLVAIDMAVPEGIRTYWNLLVTKIISTSSLPIPELQHPQQQQQNGLEHKPAVVERIPSVAKDISDFWSQLSGTQKVIFGLSVLNCVLIMVIWHLDARLKVLEQRAH